MARDTDDGPSLARRLASTWIARIAVLIVLGVGWLCFHAKDWLPGPAQPYAYGTPVPTGTPPRDNGPFTGTPAQQWAEGADGLVMPSAAAVTDYSADQVAADLDTVRNALIAGHLDIRMLTSHDPSALLALLAPKARPAFAADITHGRAILIAPQVASGADLSSWAPRESGATTFSSVRDDHGRQVVRVVTNYVWVYAFRDRHVEVVHDQIDWTFYAKGQVPSDSVGLWASSWTGYFHNGSCTAAKRGQLAPPDPDQPITSTEDDQGFYEPGHVLTVPDTCA